MKTMKRILASLLCLALCMACLPGIPVLAKTTGIPTLTLSEVIAEPGADVTLEVELSENPGLMAILFEISYDHALLTLTGIEDAGLTDWDRSEDRVVWLGDADSSFNGTILRLNFKVAAAAGAGDIPVTLLCNSGDVGNHDEESYLPKINAGKVHIHGWGDPSYAWAADNSSVTATRVCTADSSHVETETVNTTSEVTTPATCEAKGKTTYTAAFTNPAFATQTKTVADVPVLGHDYQLTGWSWTGYTAASATFTCTHDASHVQTVSATITSVRTEPSAEQDGSVVYTATVTFEGQTYSDTKTEVLPALGHDYELSGWSWTGYTAAVATFTDKNGGAPLTVNAAITSVRTEPTCETAGSVVYTATVTVGGQTYTDTKTETLPALGHDWGAPTYEWATDNSKVTAKRVCKNDASHVETETVNTTSAVTTPATCTGMGKTTYTATFTNPVFATQTKTVTNVPALGHDWAASTYEWSADNSKVTAKRVCKNDASHVETETVNTTSAVTAQPTCTAQGKTTYTAVFTNPAFATQTKTVTNVPVLGHDWDAPTYEWAADNSKVTAKRVCKNDASHVETETVDTVGAVTTPATCTGMGKTTYTAVFTNPAFATQTKTVTNVPALGHAYMLTGWSWTGYTAASALFTCQNDASHVVTVNATITSVRTDPTSDTDGSVVYTATVSFEGTDYTDVKTEILPALGRDYELTGWSWTGYTAATATFNDKNGSGEITVNALITIDRTEPDCEHDGQAVYTATVTLSGQTYTDTKTETLPALGHSFGAWARTTEPTCTEAGVETRTCSRCGAAETRPIDALGHDPVHHDAKAPTCTEIGWNAYDTCTRCDYTTYAELPALGHDLIRHDAKAPSCTEIGWDAYDTCSRCDYTTYAEIPATGHTPAAAVEENRVEPTCTATGSCDKVVYCSVCGAELSRETEILAALGHDLVHHDAQAPTCTEIGWEAYDSCSRCDYTTCVEIPAPGHTPGEPVEENRVEPTCTEIGGYDSVVYCTVCNTELSRAHTELAAFGHDWGEPSYVWAEDHSTATATRVCKNDESHVETETVNASSEVIREATMTEEGEILFTAVFENEAFETQTATVITPKLGDGLPCDGGDDCPGNVFTDMPPKGNWAHDAIDWAIVHGITAGTSPTTFSPSSGCTRGQVVTFLWRAAGQPSAENEGGEVPFTDINPGAFYYKAVLWAVEKGITKGTSDTTFSPGNECTRGQIVTFLWRFEEEPAATSAANPFEDVNAGAFYYKAVLWAVEKGITKGTSDTTFSPSSTCTRAQVVTFLYRDVAG